MSGEDSSHERNRGQLGTEAWPILFLAVLLAGSIIAGGVFHLV